MFAFAFLSGSEQPDKKEVARNPKAEVTLGGLPFTTHGYNFQVDAKFEKHADTTKHSDQTPTREPTSHGWKEKNNYGLTTMQHRMMSCRNQEEGLPKVP